MENTSQDILWSKKNQSKTYNSVYSMLQIV